MRAEAAQSLGLHPTFFLPQGGGDSSYIYCRDRFEEQYERVIIELSVLDVTNATMDGLSALASLIAVAQISGSIVSLCYEYRNGLQTSSKDMKRLVTEVKSLRDVLETLISLVD